MIWKHFSPHAQCSWVYCSVYGEPGTSQAPGTSHFMLHYLCWADWLSTRTEKLKKHCVRVKLKLVDETLVMNFATLRLSTSFATAHRFADTHGMRRKITGHHGALSSIVHIGKKTKVKKKTAPKKPIFDHSPHDVGCHFSCHVAGLPELEAHAFVHQNSRFILQSLETWESHCSDRVKWQNQACFVAQAPPCDEAGALNVLWFHQTLD